jgi:hypothetical protein
VNAAAPLSFALAIVTPRPARDRRTEMGLIEIVLTVCALSLPDQCEDKHLQFAAGMSMSLTQCVMNAQPYIAQWINEHPKWLAVRWRCEYGASEEKT